eukprot:evm.model.scf_1650.1 EVM.evm.TU.scf_1650.1   scf_1650:812-3657(-)
MSQLQALAVAQPPNYMHSLALMDIYHSLQCCPKFSTGQGPQLWSTSPSVWWMQDASNWGSLPFHLLDMIKLHFNGAQESAPMWNCPHKPEDQLIHKARLVNRHWCQWGDQATRSIAPSSVRLANFVAIVKDKFVEARWLRLRLGSSRKSPHRQLRWASSSMWRPCLFDPWNDRYEGSAVGVIESIAPLTSLQGLNLAFSNGIEDKSLRRLASLELPWLSHLDLRVCTRLTDQGMQALRWLPGLRYLNLSGCCQMGNVGMRHVQLLTKLEHLNICGCPAIGDGGLACLSALQGLTALSLGDDEARWTEEGLQGLQAVTSLQWLRLFVHIADCEYWWQWLMPLKHLTQLEVRQQGEQGYRARRLTQFCSLGILDMYVVEALVLCHVFVRVTD